MADLVGEDRQQIDAIDRLARIETGEPTGPCRVGIDFDMRAGDPGKRAVLGSVIEMVSCDRIAASSVRAAH